MADKEMVIDEWTEYYSEHTNKDYPVGVYYVNLSSSFMDGIRLHWHNAIEIDYVKSGEAIYSMGDENITVKAGSAILINEGRIHSISKGNTDQCVIISVLFSLNYLFDNQASFLSAKYRQPFTSNMSLGHILFLNNSRQGMIGIDCINDILKLNLDKKYGYELRTKGLLCNLWLQLLELAAKSEISKATTLSIIDEERVKEAVRYINSNYEKNMTLDEIADNIHLSKSECCRSFKRATNMTPFEYLMTHRIFESARKMQRNDPVCSSIADLSVSVGFNNASYYNKIFKKYTGITPTKSRELLKKSHRDALSPFGIPLSKM